MSFLALSMLIAILVDVAIGWPAWLFQRIGHPVTWIGAAVASGERWLNSGQWRMARGLGLVVLILLLTAVPAVLFQSWLSAYGVLGSLLLGILAWPFVAVRSMYEHVAAVARPLHANDLDAARYSVSMIVGRDPRQLDQAGVARSALESLAENTSDGIIAPLFWGLFFGLPGIAVYKAINTMDSMIGHRDARYELFGKAAARLDDLVNLGPARLTGAVFALVSRRPRNAVKIMVRDAGQHRSPNAGWPEGAMAGALNVRLSGPRMYGDQLSQEPWVNAGADNPSAPDVDAGLAIYRRAMVLSVSVLALIALI